MIWEIRISKKAARNLKRLPVPIRERFKALALELRVAGPVREGWPNYGKIRGSGNCHHCHIKKGKTTYVTVWKVRDDKILEVTYVGTHEGADYRRLC